MLVRDLIKHLSETYKPGDVIAYALWTVMDVMMRAADTDTTITEQQAAQVLALIDRKQDCTLGITWDTIDAEIEEVLNSAN